MKKIFLSSIILLSLFSVAKAQNVGIGTNTPSEKLDVNGGIKIGNTNNTAKGTIRWNEMKNDFEGYNGIAWVSLTGSKGSWGNQQSYATENSASQFILNHGINGVHGNGLGSSLSVSGSILAAGARGDNRTDYPNILHTGRVILFKRITDNWILNGTVENPNQQAEDHFGTSVSFFNENLMVGATGVNQGTLNTGKAYIFKYDTATTQVTLQSTLAASDADGGDAFGHSVAINDNFAVASAPYNDIGNSPDVGRVYTFRKDGANWLQQSVLTAPDGQQYDCFGYAVTISGNWLAASAFSANINVNYSVGKVYLFKLSSDGFGWEYFSTLTPPVITSLARFGQSLHMDGDTLAIGAPEYNGSQSTSAGKTYVYHRNGNNWNLHSTLIPPDGKPGDSFGSSLRIGGGFIIVGANRANVGANSDQGKAYIYKWNGNNYTSQAILTSSNGAPDDAFGSSVVINVAGAAVGAPSAPMTEYRPDNGRVYFFDK